MDDDIMFHGSQQPTAYAPASLQLPVAEGRRSASQVSCRHEAYAYSLFCTEP